MGNQNSEVYIAAQSLDKELRSVKNLKRLSIGSMDLLMDPEMDMLPYNNGYRNSWSTQLEQGDKPLKSTRYSDPTHYNSKIVRQERLPFKQNQPQKSDKEQTQVENTKKQPGSTKSLTRRGAVNFSSRRPVDRSNHSKNPNKINDTLPDEVAQNLLWVRAVQHPNVKPENYIELVQDALHNIQIDKTEEHDKENSDTLDKVSRYYNSNNKRSPNNTGLVRRPSLLRKSYTEFDEVKDSDIKEQSSTNNNVDSTPHNKKFTLKDITEELTRISNKAGLTNNDAVTLARTLSMASVAEEDETDDLQEHLEGEDDYARQSRNNDDNYASTMLLPTDSLIKSEHSTLKRSKYTYHIRTQEDKDHTIPVSNESQHQDVIEASPGSINDIYDHYREPSGDWSSLIQVAPENENKKRTDTDIDSNTKIVQHSTEHVDLGSTGHSTSDKSDINKKEPAHRKKRNGWLWSSKTSEKVNITSDKNETEDIVPESRFNHSKNRHEPLYNHKIEIANTLGTLPEKKNAIDKKISNIFRRKHHTRRANQENSLAGLKISQLQWRNNDHKEKAVEATNNTEENNGSEKVLAEAVEVRTHSSYTPQGNVHVKNEYQTNNVENTNVREIPAANNGIEKEIIPEVSKHQNHQQQKSTARPAHSSKFRITEKQTQGQDQGQDQGQAHGSDIGGVSLQPAVNVTSTKNQEIVIQNVTVTATPSQREEATDSSKTASKKPLYPPRKLTFADVKKKDKANAPIEFTDSAFGFPLPELTYSTVIMFDHRLPIHVERAIYRLSHLKLSNSKRALREQVLLSNFMYSYLNLVNHTLYMEQKS